MKGANSPYLYWRLKWLSSGQKRYDKLMLKELFSVKDAVNMMELDALNQSINMAIRHHQCFNWTELAAQGITAGILGGTFGKAVNDGLKSLEPTGILAAEANALVTGGADSLAGGNHFDAGKILASNLGNAVGNTVVDVGAGGWKSTLEWFEHHKLMRKQEQEMQQKFNELSLNTKVPEFERFQAEIAAEAYGMEKDKSVKDSKTTSAAKDVVKAPASKEQKAAMSSLEKIWAGLNIKYETNIDFAALSEWEGKQQLRGYLPMDPDKNVKGKSGITIATGFDIGQHSAREIKSYGFPKELEDKLLPFVEVRKEAAKKLLPLAKETLLTKAEADLIDLVIHSKHIEPAIKHWNTHNKRLPNTPLFTDLSLAQQTVLMSRTFNQGPDMHSEPISQKFYQAALNNDWIAAEHHLRNYNTRDNAYINRVNKEANFLKHERPHK